MSGWPNRIARSSFGPTLVDKYPIVNPTEEVGEQALNLNFWQTSGMNVAASRGLMSVTTSPTSAETDYQGFAWDPHGLMPKIVWTRVAQGSYEFTLPDATYPDEQGNMVTVSLLGGQAIPQANFAGYASLVVTGHYERIGVRSGRVHMFVPEAANKQDVDFLCQVW